MRYHIYSLLYYKIDNFYMHRTYKHNNNKLVASKILQLIINLNEAKGESFFLQWIPQPSNKKRIKKKALSRQNGQRQMLIHPFSYSFKILKFLKDYTLVYIYIYIC